jgi:hypothetical protein
MEEPLDPGKGKTTCVNRAQGRPRAPIGSDCPYPPSSEGNGRLDQSGFALHRHQRKHSQISHERHANAHGYEEVPEDRITRPKCGFRAMKTLGTSRTVTVATA